MWSTLHYYESDPGDADSYDDHNDECNDDRKVANMEHVMALAMIVDESDDALKHCSWNTYLIQIWEKDCGDEHKMQ